MTSNAVLDEAYQRLHGKGPEFGGTRTATTV